MGLVKLLSQTLKEIKEKPASVEELINKADTLSGSGTDID